jgi:hypothetical protein
MYKQCKNFETSQITNCVQRLSDNAFIPFAPDNTDYAQFKVDLAEGVTLLDAEGIAITPEQVQALLEELH